MSMPMGNAEKLLEALRERGVPQKPRWKFFVRNAAYWIAYGFFMLLGGVAFSIILYAALESEFDLLSYHPRSPLLLFLKLLPLFWIACAVLCTGVSLFGIRHTKAGYRYSLPLLIGTSIVSSIVLGTLFFFAGGAERIEQALVQSVGAYQGVAEKKMALWSMPEDGFLSGKIFSMGEVLVIEDFAGETWSIDITNSFVRPGVSLEVGVMIKMIGRKTGESAFAAEEIRPWEGRGMQRNPRNRDL